MIKAFMNYPSLVFIFSLVLLWVSAQIGVLFRSRRKDIDEEFRADLGIILAATLTLLGLIIGFTFSMATSRYDQRKHYEEEEANAIGTEYLRVELLPAADAGKLQSLLGSYLDQRIAFYTTRDSQQLERIDIDTSSLQAELWSAIKGPAPSLPAAVANLVVSGMNDVLNSQGYTQAAWWNRIPVAAWGLMEAIAIFSNVLIGYGARRARKEPMLLLILPLLTAISFFLIADIDSPRGGLIQVQPQNLISLASSLRK